MNLNFEPSFLKDRLFFAFFLISIKETGAGCEKLLSTFSNLECALECADADFKVTQEKIDEIQSLYNEFITTEKIHMLIVQDTPELAGKEFHSIPVLFYKGKLPDFSKKTVSFAGARASTAYGRSITEHFASVMAENNVQVVEGSSVGINASAAMGALKACGHVTIACACGLDRVYPAENKELLEKVLENGCLISPYPPGTAPVAQNFVAISDLISGLANVLCIVEAREKSGALVAADMILCKDKGILCAIPGRITDPMSRGCCSLIKSGAPVILCPDDVLELLEEERS